MIDENQKLLAIKKKFVSMHRAEKKKVSDTIIAEITKDVIERAKKRAYSSILNCLN